MRQITNSVNAFCRRLRNSLSSFAILNESKEELFHQGQCDFRAE